MNINHGVMFGHQSPMSLQSYDKQRVLGLLSQVREGLFGRDTG